MPGEKVDLVRVPIDVACTDCGKKLPFGAWAYFNADSEQAICVECAARRGWASKDRVKDIIIKLELQEDIKALKKERQVWANALHLLKEQTDLHRLGERIIDLEKQATNLMGKVQSYFQKCAGPEEKKILQQVCEELREVSELQKEIREHLESRLFLLERKERKQKRKAPLMEETAE